MTTPESKDNSRYSQGDTVNHELFPPVRRISPASKAEVKDSRRKKFPSAAKSIRNRCLDCQDMRHKLVRNCPLTDCHLYTFRLGNAPRRSGSRMNAIRKHCVHDCMNNQPGEVRLCPTKDCPLYPFRFGRKSRMALREAQSEVGHRIRN